MANDLVSIVVPTYNRAYCIRKTLDSVVAQTHTNWEVLLVDDGSTDNTCALIAEAYGAEPRIRYIHQANAGVSHARNTGIRAAQGDCIAFLDSDDVWKPWKLKAQIACLERFPEIGMVWTNMEAVDPEGHLFDPRHLAAMYSAYSFFEMDTLFEKSMPVGEVTQGVPDPTARLYRGDIYTSMIMGNLVHTSTVLLRRERMEKVKTFDETLKLSGEDYDFHLRTCKWGPVALMDISSIEYQKGRADHLSNHSGAIATNFLITIERAIEDDTKARRFPPARVKQVLAEAHGWVAEERFKVQDRPAVRSHAIQSLRRRPKQPRLMILLLSTLIPALAMNTILRGYHKAKTV
ncbi:glycosyltransferase family 2 protein [Granulicella sibirica]|uniref:Beta-1,3-glucosyltransferase n=1 Tax=Granulicella sibirica TaxID=2479048 RepID=A0A4Q0SV18_9BACT|nr:glycosyltransferase family 2 protein [Granulicella sibirica]RXH54597.1 Beta-1,3-glucosyltransferase [Granulicella sibirica]